MSYLYIGTAVPIVLLVLRQALDFSFKEELVMNSLADYILQARSCKENPPAARKYEPVQAVQKTDPVFKEEMVVPYVSLEECKKGSKIRVIGVSSVQDAMDRLF